MFLFPTRETRVCFCDSRAHFASILSVTELNGFSFTLSTLGILSAWLVIS
jgi:hypothetical protein